MGHAHSGQRVALVVLDKQDYIKKVENMLKQEGIYRSILTHPTNRQKDKLINLDKSNKAEGQIGGSTYRRM